MKKLLKPFFGLHWSAKAVLKAGMALADALLLAACWIVGSDEALAIQMVQTSVYLFGEAVVGGLFIDVVAKRMGLEDSTKK